jgi:hypothetical protein
MGHAYCTLFDREFLFRGLALYESLERNAGAFTLWILCMDDTTYETLARLPLPQAELIRLADFEDDALRAARLTRNVLEYCWTCTPSFPLWVLRRQPKLDSITYVDADLMFFSDPEPLFDELGADSISIIEHRYAPRWEHLVTEVGIYNVEYLTFRNDERGLHALGWWRDRCIEWCYDRLEDGKIADQMYLDYWPERFPGVVVLQHPGAGLAPWNVERYEVDDGPDGITVDGRPLIFYHYSSFAIADGGAHRFAPAAADYRITSEIERIVYAPYILAIKHAIGRVQAVEPGYAYGFRHVAEKEEAPRLPQALKTAVARFINALPPLRRLWQKVRGD